ncbi:MBL fold metallo-hydrolase [Chitinophaga sp. CF418]|uniref:MBL fold metallo-hydrolase n=1 Tax=Chitinophaga sp. CF418 TaxID=1855287 RepID=UPI0009181D49|nr:MBL fold metallo-hydrolase [Chitinophaga sp. CF418]SHN36107.1 Glyoxylase, beta-lactamase superfamily II [Chitinophaga sp. CF418]
MTNTNFLFNRFLPKLILSFCIMMGVALYYVPVTFAQDTAKVLPQPGSYHMMLGDVGIIAFSDGSIPQDLNKLLTNTQPGEIKKLTELNFQTPIAEASVNAYLIKTNGKLILVDAGTSALYGPTLGHLPRNMIRAGYKPEQIDAVLVTHIHTDHTGGLMDGDKMVFPNADIYVSKKEADYWLSDESYAKAPARLKPYFDQARLKMLPYVKAGKVKTYEYGKELFPGILPVASAGHTPGHSFYQVNSKREKILFWGDIMHSAAVQFADPDVTIVYDVDPAAAAQARKKAYEDAAKGKYWIAADHVSFPGIGHIRKREKGYGWFPINYTTSGIGQ